MILHSKIGPLLVLLGIEYMIGYHFKAKGSKDNRAARGTMSTQDIESSEAIF